MHQPYAILLLHYTINYDILLYPKYTMSYLECNNLVLSLI